jgi:GH25 family lysozyme M1 (1,4-beta-N-acetylmuramidase)
MLMTTFGVDISNWQNGIDIKRIAAEGFKYCVCKASQNTNFRDAYFTDHVLRAKFAGMLTGGYHWIHNNNGARQADIFYGRMCEVGGPSGMIAALDVEEVADAPSWDTLIAFRDRWSELSNGHPLLIYTGKWWWPDDWHGPSLSPYLWHSEYVGGNDYASNLYEKVPSSYWNGYGGWDAPTILQFSSTGLVSNKAQVDVDAIPGDISSLNKLIGKTDMSADFSSKDPFGSVSGNGTYGEYLRHLTAAVLTGTKVPGATEDSMAARLARIEAATIALLGKPAGALVLSDEDRDAIVRDVAAELKPQFIKMMSVLVNALGGVLDELNND